MKRNILLLFGLIGFLIAEWGCQDNRGSCGNVKDPHYVVKGIDSVQLQAWEIENTSVPFLKPYKTGDTIAINRLSINVTFLREVVSNTKMTLNTGYSAYAIPCYSPMDINDWELDSMEVIQIINGIETHIDSISLSYKYKDYLSLEWQVPTNVTMLNNLLGSEPNITFGILKQPKGFEKQSYRVRFFVSDGTIFETTSSTIFVKP